MGFRMKNRYETGEEFYQDIKDHLIEDGFITTKNKQESKTDNNLDMKLKLMAANINGYTQGLNDAANTEQEPVLDKIRAEIMDTGAYEQEVHGKTEFLNGINYCLGVIDKYKVESEVDV